MAKKKSKKKKDLVIVAESLVQEDWYLAMIDDCEATITESVFASRWALIEGYHKLGARIEKEKKRFNRAGLYGKKISETIANSLSKSVRTINRAVQFYKKYPDVNKLPGGKNVSWSKIVRLYLSEPDKDREERLRKCKHLELRCIGCGKVLKKEILCQQK